MSFLRLALYQWVVMPFSVFGTAWKQGSSDDLLIGILMIVIHIGFTAMYFAGFQGISCHPKKLKFFLAWTTGFLLIAGPGIYFIDKIILLAINK